MLANLLTRHNHHQIPHIANLVFIMRHELSRKSPPLSILGNHLESIHGDVDRLLHLIGHDLSDEGAAGIATGWVVDEVPSGDGGHVGEFLVGHFFEAGAGDRTAIVVGVDGLLLNVC